MIIRYLSKGPGCHTLLERFKRSRMKQMSLDKAAFADTTSLKQILCQISIHFGYSPPMKLVFFLFVEYSI